MKSIITIEDNLETGEVEITGEVPPCAEGQLPTGAQILGAYLGSHIEQVNDAAVEWFRNGMLAGLANQKDEIDVDS